MTTTIWIKDGVTYQGGGIVIGDMRYFNPTPEQFRQAGYTEYVPPTPVPPSTEDFDNACAQFRQVCAQISLATGIEGFKGGFDEMVEFQQSPVYSTIPGLQLAMAWSAANELCKYTGSKLGYGQPEWWYRCWAEPPQEPVDDTEVAEDTEWPPEEEPEIPPEDEPEIPPEDEPEQPSEEEPEIPPESLEETT